MTRADPPTRARLRRQMQRNGIDVEGRITEDHRLLAYGAGVHEPLLHRLVDDWLYNMTQDEAIKLLYNKRLAP